MMGLLKIWSLSHFKLLKANTLVTLLGISFGVALFTAIQISNHNIMDSFQWTVNQIAGKSQLEITGPDSGFSEEKIIKARRIPGIQEAMPVTIQSISIQNEKGDGEEGMVLGLDLLQDFKFHEYTVIESKTLPQNQISTSRFLEPGSIMISSFLADHFHLHTGSDFSFKFGLETIQTHVIGIIQFQNGLPPPYGGYFAIMDIASAQMLFHKLGKLDRISFLVEEGVSLPLLERELEKALPGLHVQRPKQRNIMVENMLGSFNLNLTALSEISIFVGMFLIYNTLSMLVVRRKAEIGVLRSIGVSGQQVLLLIILEAILLGTVGSLLGLGFGVFISQWVLKAVSLTITSLYLKVFIQKVFLPVSVGLESFVVGLSVSILAAFFPAWEASKISPRDILVRQGEIKKPVFSVSLLMMAIFCLILSLSSTWIHPVHRIPIFGYFSAFSLLLGLSLLIPSVMFVLYQFLCSPLFKHRFVFFRLAGASFFQHPGRNSITIAALMMSVSLLISVTLMIHSFRKTVNAWIEQTIKADFVIEPSGWLNPGPLPFISPDLAAEMKNIPGIAAIDLYREDHLIYNNEPFQLNSRDLSIHEQYSQYLMTERDSSKVLKEAIDQKEVLISERFSLQHHLHRGDNLTLNTPHGSVSFKVGGIFYDYTTQGGRVVMDRSLYLKYWNDPLVNVLAVYLAKGHSLEETKGKINSFIKNKDLLIISNHEIKTKVLEIFDETFAITRVLEWITILISLLGVANTLLANILEQKREIGILRSMGFSRNQIGNLTLYEAGWIAFIANLLGFLGGMGLSLILIFVINKQSFLWSIQFDFSWTVFFRTFLIVILTAILAGYFPARKAAKSNIAAAVQYE